MRHVRPHRSHPFPRTSFCLRVGLGMAGLGLSATAAPADAHAAPESSPFGVNAHQASNEALQLAADAGIGWVRFDMNWFQFEPTDGGYNWTEADRFIDQAEALELNVFVTIAYTPSWAAQPCNDADPNPVNWCLNAVPSQSDWTSFVTAAVDRYQDRVTHWGMWNEPNLLRFFKGTRDDYVNTILVPGSNAVHAACPSCKVLGPELANLSSSANWDADNGTCVGNNCLFNGWNYSLDKILEVAGSSIDIVTHHKYADPASVFWSELTDGQFEVVKTKDGVKELTDAHVPGKPVWITELGWEAEPYGEYDNVYATTQLELAMLGFCSVHEGTQPDVDNQPWPELKKIFWYDLHDDPNGFSWGLLDENLNKKPQYDAYRDSIAALGPCTVEGEGGAGAGGADPSGGTGGATGGSSSAGASAAVGGAASGGSSTGSAQGGAGTDGSPSADGSDDGCGCRLAGARAARDGGDAPDHDARYGAAALLLLGGVGLGRRRRKRYGYGSGIGAAP